MPVSPKLRFAKRGLQQRRSESIECLFRCPRFPVSFPKLAKRFGNAPLPETPFHLQASHRNTGTAPGSHSCAEE